MSSPPRCTKCEQPMVFSSRFKFDHEPGDDPKTTASLKRFKEMGLELGATVTLYLCPACDNATAFFEHDP